MVDQIYRDLGSAIITGKFPPGTPLIETDLQQSFGVSRAPVREAIRLLEADGLVVVDSYKKKYVRCITRSYLQELIPIMAVLEGLAGSLAVQNFSNEQIEVLRSFNENMKATYEQGLFERCSDLDFNFHKTFIKASGNQELEKSIKSIRKKMSWFWVTRFPCKGEELIPISIEGHQAIIEAFKTRSSKKVEAAIKRHFFISLNRSLDFFKFDSNGNILTELQ